MPRKNMQKEKRRQILDALDACLLKKPFLKTSIKDIAREAGVNHGVMHYYFKSKDDILLHYIDFTIEKYNAVYSEWFESISKVGMDEREIIEEALKLMIGRITLNADLSRIFIEIWEIAVYNKKVRERLKKMYAVWESTLETLLTRLGRNKKESKYLSKSMVAFAEGIALFSIIFEDTNYPIEAVLKKFQRYVSQVLDAPD
jgi:TetR/AcrR family transcriptional regulator, transcriptional repressor of bet genes